MRCGLRPPSAAKTVLSQCVPEPVRGGSGASILDSTECMTYSCIRFTQCRPSPECDPHVALVVDRLEGSQSDRVGFSTIRFVYTYILLWRYHSTPHLLFNIVPVRLQPLLLRDLHRACQSKLKAVSLHTFRTVVLVLGADDREYPLTSYTSVP